MRREGRSWAAGSLRRASGAWGRSVPACTRDCSSASCASCTGARAFPACPLPPTWNLLTHQECQGEREKTDRFWKTKQLRFLHKRLPLGPQLEPAHPPGMPIAVSCIGLVFMKGKASSNKVLQQHQLGFLYRRPRLPRLPPWPPPGTCSPTINRRQLHARCFSWKHKPPSTRDCRSARWKLLHRWPSLPRLPFAPHLEPAHPPGRSESKY